MQALHRKLDVVLVQIMPHNCPETDYSFCEDSPSACPLPGCVFHPQTSLAPPNYFFAPPPLHTRATDGDVLLRHDVLARYIMSSCVCLSVSVCASVTRRYCIEMATGIELGFFAYRFPSTILHCVLGTVV